MSVRSLPFWSKSPRLSIGLMLFIFGSFKNFVYSSDQLFSTKYITLLLFKFCFMNYCSIAFLYFLSQLPFCQILLPNLLHFTHHILFFVLVLWRCCISGPKCNGCCSFRLLIVKRLHQTQVPALLSIIRFLIRVRRRLYFAGRHLDRFRVALWLFRILPHWKIFRRTKNKKKMLTCT